MLDRQAYVDTLSAFRDGDFSACANAALGMLTSGANHEVFQVLLISLQRVGQKEEAEQIGGKILAATAHRPWYQTLLRVTLGQIDGGDAVAQAGVDADAVCQAHFYHGARLATLGHIAGARQALDACLASAGECIERKVLAEPERERLPRTDEEVVALNARRQVRLLAGAAHDLFRDGKKEQACVMAQRAHELARLKLGETDPEYLSTLGSYGTVLHESGDPVQAFGLFQEQFQLAQRLHGEESPEIAEACGNLALTLSTMGRFAEAEPFCAKAVLIYTEKLGKKDVRTLASLGNMALNLRRQTRYQEAAMWYLKYYELKSGIYSPGHPESLRALGYLVEMYEESGAVQAAETLRAKIQELQDAAAPSGE